MSVQTFYRVQCSGNGCNSYLIVHRAGDNRTYGTVTYSDHATEFDTWASADEAAAKAGWHDGSQGQFAPEERKKSPWLVPLCPRCRAQT